MHPNQYNSTAFPCWRAYVPEAMNDFVAGRWAINSERGLLQIQLYRAIGRNPPLPLFFSTGTPGNFVQVANTVKNLCVHTGSSFSPSIHCRKATPIARHMLFMIRRPFAEPSVSTPTPTSLNNTLVRPPSIPDNYKWPRKWTDLQSFALRWRCKAHCSKKPATRAEVINWASTKLVS